MHPELVEGCMIPMEENKCLNVNWETAELTCAPWG